MELCSSQGCHRFQAQLDTVKRFPKCSLRALRRLTPSLQTSFLLQMKAALASQITHLLPERDRLLF